MATGETGFADVTYDLIAVQYHALEARPVAHVPHVAGVAE